MSQRTLSLATAMPILKITLCVQNCNLLVSLLLSWYSTRYRESTFPGRNQDNWFRKILKATSGKAQRQP